MKTLIDRFNRLKKDYKDIYQRKIFKDLESDHRIIGVVGGRGVGKTTYLFNYLALNYKDSTRVLYVSADDVYFSQNKLIDLARQFVDEYDGKLLCIDEVHRYPNWSQELKNIYDIYGKRLKIIFTGSSVIDLIKQKYDLSRRAVLKKLPGFSFREYLEYSLKLELPVLTLDKIVKNRITSIEKIIAIKRLLGAFKKYIQIGHYPLFREFKDKNDLFDAINGAMDKVINIDIASYYSLKTETLSIFKKILYFIATSTPGKINANKIANSLGKSFPDTSRYIEMIQESGLIRYLLNDKAGHALIRNAEKVYLGNTSLAYALEHRTGKPVEAGMIRELFIIDQLESAGYKVFYSAKGDILVAAKKNLSKEYVFEMGGKSKDSSQIRDVKNSYLVLDDIIYGDKRSIPMYLFGFLY